MLQTLFHIPTSWMGWSLFLWILTGVAVVGWTLIRRGWEDELRGYLLLFAVGGSVLYLLPNLAEISPAKQVLGLPIRGYGVMLLLGMASGIGCSVYLARRMGFDPELMFSLNFWMIVAGLVGARLFYVIQYWHEKFQQETIRETLLAIIRFTEGGIVVYGALIGGLLAVILFVYVHKLPVLAVGDLLAPGMVLGLTLGRIGCMLNGCCWGGTCEASPLGVYFPRGSPPYIEQLQSGRLLGMKLSDRAGLSGVVTSVDSGDLAEAAGIRVGQRVTWMRVPSALELKYGAAEADERLAVLSIDGSKTASWSGRQLPSHARPVHPTQVYSSITALLLFILLVAYYPSRRRDGQVFALFLTAYPLARFLLEFIRADEPGRLGTALTISQMVGLGILLLAIVLWCYVLSRPRLSVLPPERLPARGATADVVASG